jgi:NitT/TauT family transport system permease protein
VIRRLLPAASFVIALALWEVAVRGGWVAEYILPAPSMIAEEIYKSRWLLLTHSYVTALEILLGFVLAVVLGIALAILLVYVRVLEPIIYPWVVVSQVVPKVAIAPLFLMWLGFGLLPKVFIAFLVAFFPILVDAMIGFRSVENEPVYLLQSMGADRLRCFWHVQVPTALPNIFGGMKVAITLATVGAIVGEFVGANVGLGYLLLFANGVVNSRLLFAALVIISLLAVVLYWAVGLMERTFISWHISHRHVHQRATL